MSEETKKPKVKVFSTPTCPWCAVAKDYLKKNSIEFEDIDVSRNTIMANAMYIKSGQMGVPQLWIDDAVVVGFDHKKINKLLDIEL